MHNTKSLDQFLVGFGMWQFCLDNHLNLMLHGWVYGGKFDSWKLVRQVGSISATATALWNDYSCKNLKSIGHKEPILIYQTTVNPNPISSYNTMPLRTHFTLWWTLLLLRFRYGRRPVYIPCLILLIVSTISLSFSPNFVVFFVIRFFTALFNIGASNAAYVIGRYILIKLHLPPGPFPSFQWSQTIVTVIFMLKIYSVACTLESGWIMVEVKILQFSR